MPMTIDQLKTVHPLHNANKRYWDFLLACYEGIRSLIDWGVFTQHERESIDNFNRRVAEAYGFGYSASIVDIFNFYLFKKAPNRDLGPLKADKQYGMFQKDADLYGEPYDSWLLETGRFAAILGHVGILVDKSSAEFGSKQAEQSAGVYPYVARYFPQAILDWDYDKDQHGRPYLEYVKLLDEDGTYRYWDTEVWETYVLTEEQDKKTDFSVRGVTPGKGDTMRGGGTTDGKQEMLEPVEFGINPFVDPATGRGEVPFVWYYNLKSKTRNIGVSDIKDVGYIDASIIRNLSEGEEVILYAAFPMMRRPMREAGAASEKGPDEAGVTAILEFDPEHGEAGKPDWLAAEVKDPVDAMLLWMAQKVEEIYRSSNAGGMASTEIQTQAKSGTALKAEFQLLNSKLVSKGQNTEKADKGITRYWMMWQKQGDKADSVTSEWPRSYDVEDLAQDLENALTSKTLVQSELFHKAIQKRIARQMLPSAEEDVIAAIDKEIDESEPGGPSGFGAGAPTEEGGKPGGGRQPTGGRLVPLEGGAGGGAPEGGAGGGAPAVGAGGGEE